VDFTGTTAERKEKSDSRAEATPLLLSIIEFLGFAQVRIMKAPPLPLVALALLAGEVMAFAQHPITTSLEQMSSADALARAPKWLLRGTPQQRAWAPSPTRLWSDRSYPLTG